MQNVYEKNTINDDVILKAKEGDLKAREFLLVAFTPLIISLVKKYNIPGYTFDDLVQHCNLTLLHALSLFKFSGFFPSYIKIALSNNLKYLCRGNVRHGNCTSLDSFVPNSNITYLDALPDPALSIEDEIIRSASSNSLMSALEYLEPEEKRLILFILSSDIKCPIVAYARKYNLDYSRCKYTKKKAFTKLRNILKNFNQKY